MSNIELRELARHLDAEVLARCAGDEDLEGPEDGFTDVMLEYLARAGQVDSWEIGYAKKPGRKGAPAFKINAWHIHSQGDDDSAPMVDIFVSFYEPEIGAESVPRARIAEHFQWARNFLESSLTGFGGRMHAMEESAPPYESVQTIYRRRAELETARIFLLTNGVAKQSEEVDTSLLGVRVKHFLWDLEKLRRLLGSGRERETIVIDLENDYGGGVSCISQDDGTGEYTAYLSFFPASLLARIYSDYGPRLLEKNVRSYLQARGKVNRGIQSTIREAPQRFLAYNNGISATAESVEICKNGKLSLLRDFQIVNGGQTTASIYHALRKEKADIAKVSVQVKVTVVHNTEKVAEFVPLISLYANSQNKVNTADFSANDVFHQKLESLSRTIWASPVDGMSRGTRWYYERARGSHLDDKANAGTPLRQKNWLAENPMAQKFTKTDLAKYEHAWDQLPHIVGKGAEKNFIEWTLRRAKTNAELPDQLFFKRLIGKAILWRQTEKIVTGLKQGGYRANVVAYTLAWLSRSTSGNLDLLGIWENQKITKNVEDAIRFIAIEAFDYLTKTAGGRNVTEWAKREECWDGFKMKNIQIPEIPREIRKPKTSAGNADISSRTTGRDKLSWQTLFGDVQKFRIEIWNNLAHWGKETGKLEPWQQTLCTNFHAKLERGKKPRIPECVALLDMLDAACDKGFQL